MALDEQIAILKQVGNFVLQVLALPDECAALLGRPAAFGLRLAGGQAFADAGHSMQHGLAQIRQDMKLADLVRDVPEDFRNRARI
jgi:hypothetical protein